MFNFTPTNTSLFDNLDIIPTPVKIMGSIATLFGVAAIFYYKQREKEFYRLHNDLLQGNNPDRNLVKTTDTKLSYLTTRINSNDLVGESKTTWEKYSEGFLKIKEASEFLAQTNYASDLFKKYKISEAIATLSSMEKIDFPCYETINSSLKIIELFITSLSNCNKIIRSILPEVFNSIEKIHDELGIKQNNILNFFRLTLSQKYGRIESIRTDPIGANSNLSNFSLVLSNYLECLNTLKSIKSENPQINLSEYTEKLHLIFSKMKKSSSEFIDTQELNTWIDDTNSKIKELCLNKSNS
jgi:hypothetical protein